MRSSIVVGWITLLTMTLAVQAQQFHRNPFEGRQLAWVKGAADAEHKEELHELTTITAHAGQQSEHIRFTTEQGTHVYYTYHLGHAEVTEELRISLWLKANRPGMQLLARLVLPRERDPNNLDQPLTTMLRGDAYELVGRWQRREFRDITALVLKQQQLMQFELKRSVNFEGAYIDQVFLNAYGGKGLTEIWIDDLEAGPIVGEVFQPAKQKTPGVTTGAKTPSNPTNLEPPRNAMIELAQTRLLINKRPFFIRGIRHSDTPLEVLRNAGFNTLFVDANTPEETLEEAVRIGFWLAPDFPILNQSAQMDPAQGLAREIARFPFNDAVLMWYVGNALTVEQAGAVAKATNTIRSADPLQGRPIAGDIWDGYSPYSRHLDLVGMHRWPLMTSLELSEYRNWLRQRVDLAEPDKFAWTWIQTHLPDWFTSLAYEQPSTQAFKDPIGPQPEQIRLLTYVALSAGYRGLGFWSDRFLANSHHGRDRLLTLATLNQELELLEPMLSTAQRVNWIKTKKPEVMAAVMRYEGGVLVLPIWLGKGAQFVPGQLATNELELIVPGTPSDAQVWEVSPGDLRSLAFKREAGGIKVTLPEFGLTTAIVFTSDINQIGELQKKVGRTRRLAAQYAYDLSIEELKKVEFINTQLEQLGAGQPDGRQLLEEARRRLNVSRDAWTRGTQVDYREAFLEAQRAMRALRILQRAHWRHATERLDSPVASPYAVSYFTLPKHWQFMEELRNVKPQANLLANGDFELPPEQTPQAWSMQQETLDDVQVSASRVADKPKEAKQCLKLEIRPKNPETQIAALERTFLAINSPVLRAQPGSLVKISGWVRVPKPIAASVDGALLFDSIGGEPLAVRVHHAAEWKQFRLYRRVPSSGTVSVTMALTGIGVAYFDDIRIEPLTQGAAAPTVETTATSPAP